MIMKGACSDVELGWLTESVERGALAIIELARHAL